MPFTNGQWAAIPMTRWHWWTLKHLAIVDYSTGRFGLNGRTFAESRRLRSLKAKGYVQPRSTTYGYFITDKGRTALAEYEIVQVYRKPAPGS